MCLGDSVADSQRSSTRLVQVLPASLLFPANHLWLVCPAHQPFHTAYGTLDSVPAAAHSQSFAISRWTTAVLSAPFSVILDAQRHPPSHRTRCGKVLAHCMAPADRLCHSTPPAPIRRERLTVHEPMSRLAPCDRGALDAPGSESTQCLIARVAHMYLTPQSPPR
jgi:hypothetical protein